MTPTRQRTTRPRKPIKHTKTFSGCWTCRARKVKCPEERPACARCCKGGLQCEGYGIKLVWIDENTQAREQNIRRVIGSPAIYDDGSFFRRVDVDAALEEIESCAEDTRNLVVGPFSIFDMYQGHGPQAVFATAPDDGPSKLDGWETEEEAIETIISDSITASTTLDSRYDPFEQGTYMNVFPLSTRHLDLLPRPAEQRALIHHWANFVCWHLVPVDREDNPFRSVFTPMALAGLECPSTQSNAQVALFHALCATAAFSRGQLQDDQNMVSTLAMKHYNLAIIHLRQSLTHLRNAEHSDQFEVDSQKGPVLATITMFSAMDMITGRSSEWRTHLQGGASWLSTIDESTWTRDKSTSMVYQGYLAIAALCNITLPSTIDVGSEGFLGDDSNYVLDGLFGLTRPILKHIIVINSLAKRISSTSMAPPSAEELDELEGQLYLNSPVRMNLSPGDQTPLATSLTIHHACVFYYASLIHFHRTLRQLSSSSPVVQDLVNLAVQLLEDIEILGADSIGCTLVWPPFIVACECIDVDLQTRILEWYACKRRHGFRNMEMSKDIAMEVWRRREIEELKGDMKADIKWQDVLTEMEMDIVLA